MDDTEWGALEPYHRCCKSFQLYQFWHDEETSNLEALGDVQATGFYQRPSLWDIDWTCILENSSVSDTLSRDGLSSHMQWTFQSLSERPGLEVRICYGPPYGGFCICWAREGAGFVNSVRWFRLALVVASTSFWNSLKCWRSMWSQKIQVYPKLKTAIISIKTDE